MTIKDGGGTILATGHLGRCRFTDIRTSILEGAPEYGIAEEILESGFMAFDFEIADVPDADFYTIEAASRGEVPFSREDLEQAGWVASMSLGG